MNKKKTLKTEVNILNCGEGEGRWNKGTYFKEKEWMYYRRQLTPVKRKI